MEEASGMWKGSAAIQGGLDSLEEKANKKLIKFRKVRCKSLDQERRSLLQCVQAMSWLTGEQLCEKVPGALAGSKLNEGLDYTPLLSTLWTVSPILHPVLSSQYQTVSWTEFSVGPP